MTGRVGFIGLGNMGAAIAERFLDAGVPLTVCDISPENVTPFREGGAEVADHAAGVADRAEVVFSCSADTAGQP